MTFQDGGQSLLRGDALAVNSGDDVARYQTCFGCRRVLLNRYNTDTRLVTVDSCEGWVDDLHGDTHDHSAADITVLNQIIDDWLCLVDGDGKADTLILGRCNLLRVDSDDLSIGVDQRTARVARVDGSIGLDAVDGAAAGGGDWTVDRRHISHCQGACQLQSARVADGDDLLTDLHLVRVSKFCRSQSGGIDLQNRKVGLFIRTDHGGIVFAVVVEHYLDAGCAADNMGICHDIAVCAQDNTRTLALLAAEDTLLALDVSHDTYGRRPHLVVTVGDGQLTLRQIDCLRAGRIRLVV